METPRRTLIKAVLWNAIGLVSMALVGLALTGSVAMGGALALANTCVGFICYLLYERIWAGIGWGRRG